MNVLLNEKTLKELKVVAKDLGVIGYSKVNKADLIALIEAASPIESSPYTGEFLPVEFTESYYEGIVTKNLTQEELAKVKAYIVNEAKFYGVDPILTWQNIHNSIDDAKDVTYNFKREQVEVVQLNVSSVQFDLSLGFYFDSNTAVAVTDFQNKSEAALANAIVKVKVTNTRSIKVSEQYEQSMLIFKSTPNNPGVLPQYVAADCLEDVQVNDILMAIYMQGITDIATDKTYLPAVQSASQARKGDLWFLSIDSRETDENGFNLEVERFRQETMNLSKESYAEFMAKMILMAKSEARVGLGVSSVLDIRFVCREANNNKTFDLIQNWNVQVTKDIEVETKVNTVTINERPWDFSYNRDQLLTVNVSDGCGMISLKACLELNHAMGLISDTEFEIISTMWKRLNYDYTQINPNTEFGRLVYEKVRNAFQIRRAVDKGLIVCQPMMDGHEKSKGIDFYMFGSMSKFGTDWGNGQLEICAVNKPKKEEAKLNFQFINALNIKPEDLVQAAAEALSPIKSDYLTNWESAMQFIGALSRFSDNDEDNEDEIVDKLKTVLTANRNMLDDTWVQAKLMDKCEKFVRSMAFGRIPVAGAFHYIITDPNYLFSKVVEEEVDHLQSGETYFNGEESDASGFRSPLVQQSEARAFHCVQKDSLYFFRDLVVLNPYDGTLPAMGGADTDGDIILFLLTSKSKFNQIIFDSLTDQHYIVYDAGISGKKVENTYENRVKHYVSTAEADLTGQITNNATIFRDMWFNEIAKNGNTESATFYNKSVFNLRFNQGWQIDKAKTGVGAEGLNGEMYPKELTPKFKPHWFVGMRRYQGRTVQETDRKTGKSIVYVSKSPLGVTYDYVNNFWNELSASVRSEKNAKYDLLSKNVDISKSKVIAPKVISLEKAYARQIASLINFRNSFEMDKADFMNHLDILNKEYNNVLLSMIDDVSGITEEVVAYTAYYATYHKENNESRSRSFIWNCMFDSICKLMLAHDNSYRLMNLPQNKVINYVAIQNGYLIINNHIKGQIDYADQECEIITKNGKAYAIVKRNKQEIIHEEEITEENKSYVLQLNGFRYYNINSEQFIAMVKENNNQFEVIVDGKENARIAVGGKIVGSVKDLMNNKELLGKTVTLSSHGALTYIAKDYSVLSRKTTAIKDASKLECYSGQIDVVCKIIGDSTTEIVRAAEEEAYVSTDDTYYSVCDNYYMDGVSYFED